MLYSILSQVSILRCLWGTIGEIDVKCLSNDSLERHNLLRFLEDNLQLIRRTSFYSFIFGSRFLQFFFTLMLSLVDYA